MRSKNTPEYVLKVIKNNSESFFENLGEEIANEDGVISIEDARMIRGFLGSDLYDKFVKHVSQELTFQ